jgi:hypothetical protein
MSRSVRSINVDDGVWAKFCEKHKGLSLSSVVEGLIALSVGVEIKVARMGRPRVVLGR